jgi:hypothetical protein
MHRCAAAPRGYVDCLLGVCSIAPLHHAVRAAFGGPMLVEPARQDGFPTRREPMKNKVHEESGRRLGGTGVAKYSRQYSTMQMCNV